MKLRLATVPIVLALAVTPVMADAPPDQYSPFVRTDNIIQDRFTGLTWQRAISGPSPHAAATCPIGYHLPTVKELLTLVDEEPHDEYESGTLVAKMIDRNAFPGTPANTFWSSSPGASGGSQAWVVSFKSGVSSLADTSTSHYVRCVR